MRYGPDDRFWIVVDPNTFTDEESDLLFESSLRWLGLQFKGGLDVERNPTLFSDRKEAEIEAYGRMTAARAARAIIAQGLPLGKADSLKIVDGAGKVLFKARLKDWHSSLRPKEANE